MELRTELLVTGFGPFLDVHDNPSAELAEWVAGRLRDVRSLVLPTSYAGATAALQEAVAELRPTALLLLGFSRHVPVVQVEARARNEDRSSSPDVDGEVGAGRTIVAEAEATLSSTADLTAVEQALIDAGVRFTSSEDAGGYVCNHLYFQALHGAEVPVVLLHVGRLTPEHETEVQRGVEAVARRLSAGSAA